MSDWERAWQRDTDTMRNDAAMIVACGTRRGGFDDDLDLDVRDLAKVAAPCLVIVGTDDPVGGESVARDLTAALPDAIAEIWTGAGHLPWLDDPARLAVSVQRFIAGARGPRTRAARPWLAVP